MTSTDDDETRFCNLILFVQLLNLACKVIYVKKLIAVLSLDGQIVIFDPYTGLTEYGIFLHTPKLLKYYLRNKIMFHKTYLDSMKQERIPTIDIFVNESLNMYNVSKLLAVSKITLAGESLYAYTHCSVLKIRLSDGKIITNNSVAEVVKLTERNFGMAASKNEVLLAYNSKKRIAYKSSLLSPKLYIGILKEISPRDLLLSRMIQFLANLRDSTDLLIVMRQLLLCKKIPGTVWKWMIKRMNEMKIQWSHSLKILRFCCVVMTQRKIISMQYVKCWENVIKKIDFILTLCYAIQLYRKLKLLLPSENPEIMDMAVQVKEFLQVYEKKPQKRKLPTRRRRKVRRLAKSAFSTSFCEICNKNYKTWIPRIGRVCEDGHLISSACLHCIRCGAIASTAIKSPAMIELFGDTVCPYCDGTFITSSIS
ncbi:hypothetical protein D917_03132 [Trichinella nativa]|uniref:Uncharacterized protein n=1 Tax=Trichinella nativa TaxID=6335 RepID=A0A1Y3EA62_9BILA|nr:hypothetical protein D917_03132 [Trichinella nativa]